MWIKWLDYIYADPCLSVDFFFAGESPLMRTLRITVRHY